MNTPGQWRLAGNSKSDEGRRGYPDGTVDVRRGQRDRLAGSTKDGPEGSHG